MANRKEHHDMTDRQRQRDIMPEGMYVVKKEKESFVMESSGQEGAGENGTGDKTRKQQ